jgi:hypothetical protein
MPPEASLPPDVYQQAATYQMGQLLQTYKPRFTNPLAILGITLGVIVVDILVMAGILLASHYIFYVLIAIPIAAIIWCGIALAQSGRRVYVFNYGMIYGKGGQHEPLRWDQIQTVWHKITQGRSSTTHSFTVQRTDGQSFKLPYMLKDILNLGTTIENEVARVRMPGTIAAYQAGQTINFGAITVDTRGISNGRKLIPWPEAGRLAIKNGNLLLDRMGRTTALSVKSAAVPNLALLDGLINYALGQGRQEARY